MMSLAESRPSRAFARLHGWARFFVLAQAFSVLLLSLLLWIVKGNLVGYSALLGGLTVILPNFYFAQRLFAQTGAQAADKIVRAFYVGEAMKLLFTVALCLLILKLTPVLAVPFFAAFVVAQMAFFWVPLINKDYPKRYIKNLL